MFPPEVKIKAMLACGRRCCLCHKFAGVGMECHHITPQAKGGENTFSNCIPLCFDCHAEVGHYSDDHPKGTKFSPDELLGHRDHWYTTYAHGTGPTAPTGYEELDKKLFLRLYKLLGGSSKMIHFRNHDYQNSYEEEIEHRLWRFTDKAGLPETEFFDAQLAATFGDLCAAIRSYEKDAEGCIWHDHQKAHIPPEWANEQENRFEEAVEKMNKAATKIWEAFGQFVKTARVRLKIEHEAEPPITVEAKREESLSRTDLDLFRKYVAHFVPDGQVINFLKHHDMAVPFHETCIEPLWKYSDIWRGPKYEFLSPELELARTAFDKKIREFVAILVIETAPSHIPNFYTMDFKDSEYRPEKLAAQKILNNLSTDAAQAYEDFYRAGKRLFRNEKIDSGNE